MKVIRISDERARVDSGSEWEPRMGYSRAYRAGPIIFVAGCVGILADGTYPTELAQQTRRCIERIQDALAAFRSTATDMPIGLDSIVMLRIYTTCIDRWPEIASVMGPAFESIRPANVLIGVARLVDADALVEIEAQAYAPDVE